MAKLEVKVGKPKAGTYIDPCQCANKYQDDVYGKGFRVYNIGKEKGTCVVCGRVKGEKK